MVAELFVSVTGWLLFVVIILGCIGNVFCFIIWTKGARCKTFTASVYLTALSVADSLTLLSGTDIAYDYATNINYIDYLRGFMCQIFPTFWHFTLMSSTYIVVCLTIERVIAVCFPFKTARWTSKRKSIIVIIIVLVVSFLLNLPWLFGFKALPREVRTDNITVEKANTSELLNEATLQFGKNSNNGSILEQILNSTGMWSKTDTNSNDILNADTNKSGNASTGIQEYAVICDYDPDGWLYKYEKEYHEWFMNFAVLFASPIAILTICNTIILVGLLRQKSRLHTQDSRRSTKGGSSDSTAMTARAVAVSLVHCITVGPGAIRYMVPEYIQSVGVVDWITKVDSIFSALWLVNHACNFVLYSALGTAFRRDFMDLFCRQCSSRSSKRNKIAKSESTLSTSLPIEGQ